MIFFWFTNSNFYLEQEKEKNKQSQEQVDLALVEKLIRKRAMNESSEIAGN